MTMRNISAPIPATCIGCGARIRLEVVPRVRKIDDDGREHVCVTTPEGLLRIADIALEFQRLNVEADRRERERLR